ncbi:MAG: hypothetical protein E7056_04655 [Lentisphaerae bacterium]|nr:hypothetical protein [Lentisphaerota bacterium]
MKWSVKLLYLLLVLVFLAAVGAMWRLAIYEPAPTGEKKSGERRWQLQDSVESIKRYPLRSSLPAAVGTEVSGSSDLVENIYRAAENIIQSTVRRECIILPDKQLDIVEANIARVSCQVVFPAADSQPETLYRCRVEVSFLPDGSTSAAFPRFTLLKPE